MSIQYIDLAILVILILSIVFGFKKGFLKTLTGLLALVLSIVLAIALYPHATKIIMKTPVYDAVYQNTFDLIEPPQTDVGVLTEFGIGKLNLPKSFTEQLEENVDQTSETIAETVANMVATAAVKLVSMLAVFLLVRLLLFLITAMAGFIKKLPLIGWGDSLLGALFGLFRGLLIVYVLLAFVTFAASMAPESASIRAIKYSKFAKVLYHDNVILDFINPE